MKNILAIIAFFVIVLIMLFDLAMVIGYFILGVIDLIKQHNQ